MPEDEPASKQQRDFLEYLGVKVPERLTKPQASELIDEAQAHRGAESSEEKPPEPAKRGTGCPFGCLIGFVAAVVIGLIAAFFVVSDARERLASRPLEPKRKPLVSRPAPVAPTNAPPAAPPAPAFKPGEERFAIGTLKAYGQLKQMPNGEWAKHGPWTNYWANGTINSWGQYRDGQPVGPWPFWLDDGRFMSTNRFAPPR